MTVRCKFRCFSAEKVPGGCEYKFAPVYEGSEENKKFFAATPYGSLAIGAIKEQSFTVGNLYYVDLIPAD